MSYNLSYTLFFFSHLRAMGSVVKNFLLHSPGAVSGTQSLMNKSVLNVWGNRPYSSELPVCSYLIEDCSTCSV